MRSSVPASFRTAKKRVPGCLLALSLLASASWADLEILVATDDGWVPAVTRSGGFDGTPGWPLPLASRSEVVQTLTGGADGFGLRVYSDRFVSLEELQLQVVEHRTDEEVLLVDGALLLVGPPTLVAADAALARQDMQLGPLAETQLRAAPEGQTTLGLPGLRDTRRARRFPATFVAPYTFDRLFAATLRPALEEPGIQPAELVDAALVDSHRRTELPAERPSIHAFGVARFGLEERQELPLSLTSFRGRVLGRGRGLELFVDLPREPLAEDRTRTLILSLKTIETPAPDGVPSPWHPVVEPAAVPLFADVMSGYAGTFVHLEGPDDQRDIRPTMGPGAAVGDIDGDGWLDLYLVQGGGREEERSLTGRLQRQVIPAEGVARPRFELVDPSGLEVPGFGMGALFFDADGDGDLDLYQANFGLDFLFANRWSARTEGQSAFAAVPAEDFARDVSGGWSAGLAAGDVDLDGDLDLYVTTYLTYDEAAMPDDGELQRYSREDPIAMLPFAFPGGRNTFLLNESDSRIRFRDATDEFDLADENGRGMQPIFWDFDSDGDVDLYVANDVSMNRLWRNEVRGADGARGTGFKDVSFSTGMDDPRGGMGVDVGDTDGDGDEDLFLSNWQLEPNALYRNNLRSQRSLRLHKATFRDVVVEAGLAPFGVGTTSWGAVLFDADCDRDLDLFIPNGYTSPDYQTTGICVGQPNQYFTNDGRGRFADASRAAGPAVTLALPSRSAVAADFDQDGDLDLVVTTNNGPAQLLLNQHRQLEKAGHYLIVRLEGADKNRFGIGAEVAVTTVLEDGTEVTQRRSLLAGKNYLAGNPPELFFGLGDAVDVPRIEVRWPTGAVTQHGPGPADTVVTLRERR